MFKESFKGEQECFMVFQEYFKGVSFSRVFRECFKGVTRVVQGCFKSVSIVYPEGFKDVSRKFKDKFSGV